MQDGRTPLYISSQCGHGGVVEVLLRNCANIQAADKVGVSIVWSCCADDVCACVWVIVFFQVCWLEVIAVFEFGFGLRLCFIFWLFA